MATNPNFQLLNQLSGTSLSFPLTIPSTTAGSLLVLCVTSSSSGTTPILSALSGGGTWTRVTSQASGSTASEMWYCQNATGATTSLSGTIATSDFSYHYAEFSGALASGALDTSGSGSVSSGSWSFAITTSGSRQDDVSLVVEFDCQLNGGKGGNNNLPSGFTNVNSAGTVASHGYLNYKVHVSKTHSTESATVSGGSAGTSAVSGIIAVFRPVSNIIQINPANVISTAGATSLTLNSAPVAGTLPIILVARSQSGGTIGGAGSITQTGATWTRIGNIQGTGSTAEMWQASVATGSESTTITFGNSCAAVYCENYGATVKDQLATANTTNNVNSGNNVPVTTGSITPSFTPEIVIAVLSGYINQKSGNWSSNVNGFLTLSNTTAGGQSIDVLYKVVTALSSVSTGATINITITTNTSTSVIASFSASAPPIGRIVEVLQAVNRAANF